MGAKGKAKKPDSGFIFVPPTVEDLPVEEEEKSIVEFTDTSYTSASWESLPSLHVQPSTTISEHRKIRKKKRRDEVDEDHEEKEEELFNYSAESLPPPPEEEEEKSELIGGLKKEDSKKDKGKGKKGKKVEEKEGVPAFEKPKNWKKMEKKEQDKWMAERLEQWKIEMEAEKQAKIASIAARRKQEALARLEAIEHEAAEQAVRRDLLQKTCILFDRMETYKREYDFRKQQKAEWIQYLRCDGLPDPRYVTQMATYLHRWKEQGVFDADELDRRCKECLPMLEMLEEFVANSRQYSQQQAENFNEIRIQLRNQLALAIEYAAYMLLRNLEENLEFSSIKIATYQRVFEGLKLNLWVAVKMPTSLPLTHEQQLDLPAPLPVELEFPGIKVSVTLPNEVDGSNVCVRAARSMIDFLSENTRSFALPVEFPGKYEDLFSYSERSLLEVQKFRKEQDLVRQAFYKQIRERERELEAIIKANAYVKAEKEKEELEELQLTEPPPMPEPKNFFGEQNYKQLKRYLKSCLLRQRPGEVNLRKYRVVGGVLNLDLLATPPQPKKMENDVFITTLELRKGLKWVEYKVLYRPPPPLPPDVVRTPEVIEVEMARIAKEMEKLALITIELPQDVLWNEQPVICQWHELRKLWTSNYIIDYKFIEEKLTVTFRTGVMWPIGIATLRYCNLPYQGWDIKPDHQGKGVMVVVTGLVHTITFNVIHGYVKLVFISNTTTPALKQIFNKKFSVKKLIQLMRDAACDIFPDFDAHNYVEGSCPKEWVMERHLYHGMAFLARSYNFQWSRWNSGSGFSKIVMQMREAVDPKREGKLSLLCVTPQNAVILKGSEIMQEWDEEPMVGMQFYPDLFCMNLTYGSVDARRTVFHQQFKLVETLFELLCELKLCSYS